DINSINDIFRAAHTFKSSAAMMGYDKVSGLCHAMEDMLDGIKKNKIKLENCVDTLFKCFDTLELTMLEIAKDKEEIETTSLIDEVYKLTRIKSARGAFTKENEPELSEDISAEFAVSKLTSLNVKTELLDTLMRLSEELLIGQMRIEKVRESVDIPELSAAVDSLGRVITDLQYNVMQSRMVPLVYVFERYPRMVRDIAKKEEKEVDLKMEGMDIELDRTIVDEIGECLVHLLRNAIDHGIETPAERKKKGKPAMGAIRLSARRDRDFSIIEVSDDGAGIDLSQIRNTAVNKGLVSEKASKEELIDVIFFGVSTTKQVSEVSGRGFGLNIVKKRIESLGGSVTVTTELKKGTTFTIEVPLSLAIIETLFVGVGGAIYAIPVVNIERLITVDKRSVLGMINNEAVILNNESIPVTRLDVLFNVPPLGLDKQPIVIVRRGQDRLGLAVDSLMETQEIVIKPLHALARKNKYLSGSTIIGSGDVVSILDVGNLMLTKRNK
ncbi:MAG: chemotaxis protein CheA, partial [Candidatus Omnitrophota bacterium]